MQVDFLHQLRGRAAIIRERWEALLRVEPVNGPLANPDALVHLIPQSLEEVFRRLAEGAGQAAVADERIRALPCDCGHNPYRAYYVAGEQAVLEAVVLLQAERPDLQRAKADLAEAISVIRKLARADIDAFCGICVHRGTADTCRLKTASARP